jgi:acetyltransferase-like isoleucine patch superfamily enzyme
MTPYARLEELFRRLGSELRIARFRMTGVRLAAGCEVAADCDLALGAAPPRRGTLTLGERTRLDRGVILHPYGGSIETGIDVYLGPGTVVYGHGGVFIGKDTLISMHCRILSSEHTLTPPGRIIRSTGDLAKPTRIGADIWLGAGVTVLGGVTIGDGCVIGAGAVVSKDLPPYSVAMGVPAVVRGRRA